MRSVKKIIISGMMVFLFTCFVLPVTAEAYVIRAAEIYRQAQNENHQFMNWLKQYNRAIDTQNQEGDTAYCMALKNHDVRIQRLLLSYGASMRQACVHKYRQQTNQNARNVSNRNVNQASITSGNTSYLWWGLGALAVGGGVAAIASSGGGGSHHKSSSTNTNTDPDDDPSGVEPGGDEPGGDVPGGDEPGGDVPGGDEPGGDVPGGDEPGGDVPGGDEPGGDVPGGDEPGGDI
ncbi:MAG: hypothetical protein J6W96_05275, partial [Alphaproteobacteria bacterium]|nr:hypothetical protein [Alphaproteobacteria bacterium]